MYSRGVLWPPRASPSPPRAIVPIYTMVHYVCERLTLPKARRSPEMLEFKSSPIPNASRPRMGLERKQPRRLLLALGILLLALVAVIIRDHDFWFGNDESALDDETTETAQPIAARSTPTATPAVVPETAPSAVQTTAHTGKPAEANKKQS